MNSEQFKSIQLLVPDIPTAEEVLPYLREIDSRRWYTNFGPLVSRFGEELAHKLGVSNGDVLTTANCTLALEAALASLLPFGGLVLVPALTFVATASAVRRAGGRLAFSDIDEASWQLTPEIAMEYSRKRKIDCVVPVSAFGCAQPADEWDRFTRETGIPVLIDAAGAFGNQEVGDTTSCVFSFHATKCLGIGEGGALVSRDATLIRSARQFENFGIDVRIGVAERVGTNAKMSEFHAAVGLAALSRWGCASVARKKMHLSYSDQLRLICPDISLQTRKVDGVYAILQVLLPENCSRLKVSQYLFSAGIETRAWYLPLLPDHPAFIGEECAGIPVSRALSPRMLGLPFHRHLSEADIGRICQSLSQALQVSGE